jgi:hypothetical protein
MGPFFVVHLKPFGAELAHLVEILEHVGVEHFVAEAAVVALDVGVLIGLARLNVTRIDAVVFSPVEQLLGDELRPVVHA